MLMADSSHRNDKGTHPALPVPAPAPPEAESDSLWDDNAFSIPQTPTEALERPDLAPLHTPGDNQPTVISRPPSQTSPEKHPLNSLRGRRLAHFELISPIGVGGMAAVIKGRDLELDRIVALKVLPPEMAADSENIRRFHQEARAAAKLDHENIARVFFYGEDQNLHFIAFEFVQGDNLRTILERRGRLPVGESLHYILQVTTGLAHASSRGVVHRDIKPSNIIITPTGRAKLVDMGLARTQIPHDERQLTQSGVTLGTFDYISPEQAMEPRSADVRSDIYSLGCTFYHMLTGHPPVPEGTAARKLHFHEHELPVDPRQLNPDIPDEVAAILSRMMAKNPRDRYQKPEHLVEELLRVAQKEDVGGERADGLLYVDAPVPSKPRRPLILLALAVAAVIALVVAVEQPGSQRSGVLPGRSFARGPDSPKGTDPTPQVRTSDKGDSQRDVQPPPVSGTPPFTWNSGSTLQDLKNIPKSPQGEIDIVLNADLDLTGTGPDVGGVALTLVGKKITIRSSTGDRKKILLKYEQDKSYTTALLLQADMVELQGLRFDLTGVGSAVNMTGVRIVGGGTHTVTDCYFYQHYPIYDLLKPMTSLALVDDGNRGGQPTLVLKECVFLGEQEQNDKSNPPLGRGGQYAIARQGTGVIKVMECLFGPHQACFHLEGEGTPKSGGDDVQVLHTSVLLSDSSAAFRIGDKGSARINVRYSLFSRPQARADESSAAVLIRQLSKNNTRDSTVRYSGQGNRYHGLDGFWLDGSRELLAATWKDFQDRIAGADLQSVAIDRFPWKDANPLSALKKLDLETAFQTAFQVKLSMPEMRLKEGTEEVLIGVRKCGTSKFQEGTLPPVEDDNPPRTVRKEKIVDPSILQAGNGIFRTLDQAMQDTQPGDVVLIKYTGKLALDPWTKKRASLDVTIKPADGFHPILTLAAEDKDSALFQLHRGQLKFHDLDFLLEPSQKDFASQAIVSLAGDGICEFKGCTMTMTEPQGCQLAVAVMGDPDSLMRRPVRSGDVAPVGPTLRFEGCLVRGKGDLLSCRASQPFKLDMRQTAVAVTGSLLSVEGSKYASDLPSPGPTDSGPRCGLDLQQVTALVSGPLIQLRAMGELKSLVPIECKASGCLLTPLGGQSLVVLAGLGTKISDAALRERLSWKGSKNVYGNFSGLVDLQPGNQAEMMKPPKVDREKWKELTSETDSKFLDQIKFTETITSAMLPGIRPAQLAVADLKDSGANTENLPDPPRDDPK
jgi:serine/threonine protein kinase